MSVTFTTLAVSLGFGQHVVHIPSAHHYRIKVYVFCVFLFSALCSGFARVSIACLLLQFTQKLSWRIAIIGIIVLQALMMSLYVITQLVQCSNLVGTGSGIPGTKCLPPSHVRSFTYAQISGSLSLSFSRFSLSLSETKLTKSDYSGRHVLGPNLRNSSHPLDPVAHALDCRKSVNVNPACLVSFCVGHRHRQDLLPGDVRFLFQRQFLPPDLHLLLVPSRRSAHHHCRVRAASQAAAGELGEEMGWLPRVRRGQTEIFTDDKEFRIWRVYRVVSFVTANKIKVEINCRRRGGDNDSNQRGGDANLDNGRV